VTATAQPASVDTARCPSCGTDLKGDFCHRCGEKRHDQHHLALKHFALHALDELTHLDSKVFGTFRYLFSRPGYLTQEFASGRKSPYMKPLSLFLLACALYFLMDSFLPRSVYDLTWMTRNDKSGAIDRMLTKLAGKKHLPKEVIVQRIEGGMHKISTAMQFANVLVLAVIMALLYHKRYFVEHLVFALHFYSFSYLAHVLLRPLAWWLDLYSLATILLAVAVSAMLFVYLFLALRCVYQQGTGVTLIKAFVAELSSQGVIVVTQVATLIVGIIVAARESSTHVDLASPPVMSLWLIAICFAYCFCGLGVSSLAGATVRGVPWLR
jgi:uncharacterized protein DUF3667